MEPFVYTLLPAGRCTRLIQLQPCPDREAPLHCKITSINLDTDDESYEAISYTWGPPTFSETLVIHDETDKACYLRITPTLASALLRFRSAWNQRLLWADAVCINQADSADKASQIPLMAQIYRSAARVLVWLGDSRQAESEMKAFARLPRQFRRVRDEITKVRARSSKWDPEGEEGRLLAVVINDVRAMFDQPWFSRRWIVQEVVVNPNVVLHCGQEEMAWGPFTFILQDFLALRISEDHQLMGSLPPFSSLSKMLELWYMHAMRAQERSNKIDLLSLLEYFEHFACADPRDRIYALAGLADNVDLQPSSPGSPAVLYNNERLVIRTNGQVSVTELYTALANAIFKQSEHDEGLHYMMSQASSRRSQTPTAGSLELPSWVPDWSSPPHLKMLHFQSQPYFGLPRFKKQPPTDTKRFSLTAVAKVITSRLSPLDAGELTIRQPGESQCLTMWKVTWVGLPYPNDPATSSAQWLVASAQQLWQRYNARGDMGDPENANLRDRFIQTLAAALFDEDSQGLPVFPNGMFDPETLTYYDPELYEDYPRKPYGGYHPESYLDYGLHNEYDSYATPSYFARAMRESVRGVLQTTIAGEIIPDVSGDPVFRWIKAIMKGRAFFTVDRNFGWNDLSSTPVDIIGIGPSDATPGDGVLALTQHIYMIANPPSSLFGGIGGLEDELDELDALDSVNGYDEARDTARPSPARQGLQSSVSLPGISLDGPKAKRWSPTNSWGSIFDMTYLVRVVNRDGSQQNLQEGLCWTLDDADEKASRSSGVGYELVGECRCAGSILGSGEQEPAGENGYTCEARDDQGTRYLITWRPEDKQVAMFFVSLFSASKSL